MKVFFIAYPLRVPLSLTANEPTSQPAIQRKQATEQTNSNGMVYAME